MLLKVELTVIRPSCCTKWVAIKPESTQICVKGNRTESGVFADSCSGDSGGPLQQNRQNCSYDLLAITSYGSACSFGFGSVYTRIASYLPWIEEIVWPQK